MKYFIVGLALLACFTATSLPGAEPNEALLERFRSEAPIAWKKQIALHRKFLAETSGVAIDSKQKVVQNGKVLQNDEYQLKQIRSNFRQMIWKDASTRQGTIECANPQYAFELSSSSSGEWVITGIHPYQAASTDESKNSDPYNRILKSRLDIQPQLLPMEGSLNQIEWLSEQVTIRDVKSVSVSNRDCVEVSIEFPFTSYQKNGNAKELVRTVDQRSAVGIFDPTKDWSLVSFVWNGIPPWTMTYTFGYEQNIGGAPFLTSSRRESRNMNTNIVKNEDIYQRSVTVEKLIESDFTLSAFGFPEPTFDQPPYWLYSSLAGLLLVIIGAILYRWGLGLQKNRTRRMSNGTS